MIQSRPDWILSWLIWPPGDNENNISVTDDCNNGFVHDSEQTCTV